MDPKGHYLVLVLEDGKSSVRREHVPLLSVDEEAWAAMGRWIESKLEGRKRNREVAANRLRATVLSYRIARPTSFYREEIEARERGDAPKKKGQRRKR